MGATMEVKSQLKDKVNVIQIIGDLDSNSAPAAEAEMAKHIVAGCCIVLDFSGLHYISSAGLRVLLMIGKQLKTAGGRWAFCGLSEETADIMEMTGFSGFFTMYPDLKTALSNLSAKQA